jgi:hypothetical protein
MEDEDTSVGQQMGRQDGESLLGTQKLRGVQERIERRATTTYELIGILNGNNILLSRSVAVGERPTNHVRRKPKILARRELSRITKEEMTNADH